MALPNDIARCGGATGEKICVDCQRRTQIKLDSEKAWFPRMDAHTHFGRCVYYIPPTKSEAKGK